MGFRAARQGFTLIELLASLTILIILGFIVTSAGWQLYASSSLAISANNIRQLAAGGMNYLADNNNLYWNYVKYAQENATTDKIWWFGFETAASQRRAEGKRDFDPTQGPLGNYVPKSFRPDPSFALGGNAFKPKYRNGYIGIGYNALLGGGMVCNTTPPETTNQLQVTNLANIVVFFTSAQVNTFNPPASSQRPMLEEFYGIDENEVTVHFRHNGKAMVSFASGNAGFISIDESTRDQRSPRSNVGRFAPVGNTLFLK